MKKTGVLAAAIGICTPFTAASLILAASPRDQLPPPKQALVDAAEAHRLAGRPADKAADPGRPLVMQTDGLAATGLLGAVAAPVSGEIFTPQNAWAGWIDDDSYVQVYAGASPSNPDEGLLFVVSRHCQKSSLHPGRPPETRLIHASLKGGPVRIVGIDHGRLLLSSPGGARLRFEPGTGAFD